MTPEEYLSGKGMKVRPAPGEWQTQCPFCGDTNKYGHLYVNREHGAWTCHRCGEKGSFYSLQLKLGDRPQPIHRTVEEKRLVWEDVVAEAQDDLLSQPDAITYLRHERGLAPETIGKYRIGWAARDLMNRLLPRHKLAALKHAGLVSDQNYPLFWDRLIIPYYQRDSIVTLRAKQMGGNVLQAKDTSVYLFGTDNLRGHAEVFICEGEFDAMLLDQMGFPACAVPGANVFQEHWLSWFEGAQRIYVALDADDAGRKGAAKIQALLGARVRLIELPVPQGAKSTDITEYFLRDLHTKDDFLEIVDRVRGRRIYSFADGIKERDDLLKEEGIKLGWRELDIALSPGLLPGQVVTVLAKTGVGKTAFITQLAHNLSGWTNFAKTQGGPGVSTFIVSLEQTKAEMANRMERIGRLYNPWASAEEINRWYCNMRICDENRLPAGDVTVLWDEFIAEVGEPPKVLVVDYLGYWARGFKAESKYVQVSEAIMELKRLAKELNVAIVAPHQVSREGKAGDRVSLDTGRDSGVVEETSDFTFGLYRPSEALEEQDDLSWLQRAELRLEILKSRHGNKGRMIEMLWAPYSLALVPTTHGVEEAVKREWTLYDAHALYSDVLSVHRGEPLRL